MRKNTITMICIMAIMASCTVSNPIQKNCTVREVQEWYKDSTTGNSVLYRGSDKRSHHFLSQFTDKWVFLTINKDELSLPDEKPYQVDSVTKLGYYYVNPSNNFAKIKDFN